MLVQGGKAVPTTKIIQNGSSLLGSKLRKKDANCKLAKFVNLYTKEDTAYFVRTTRHAQIVYNDKVRDQSGVHHINDFWGKNKFVKDFYEIPMTNKNPVTWQSSACRFSITRRKHEKVSSRNAYHAKRLLPQLKGKSFVSAICTQSSLLSALSLLVIMKY